MSAVATRRSSSTSRSSGDSSERYSTKMVAVAPTVLAAIRPELRGRAGGIMFAVEIAVLPDADTFYVQVTPHVQQMKAGYSAPFEIKEGSGEMPGWVEDAARKVEGVKSAKATIVFDPPWDASRMSDEARLQLNML